MAKLVVMLRVKDGIIFVEEWLRCFETLADEIVVLDNGSTDGTLEALRAHPKIVGIECTTGYNEGRDKNLLYGLARSRKPDWCLWLDIDEIFEAGLTRADFDKLMNVSWVNKYAFRRFHFIDRKTFAGSWFRLNYSSGHDRIMWRENSSGYFENFIIDSPNVKGITGIKINTHYRLKHLGYISKEIVDKKAEIYRAIIPEKEAIFQTMYLDEERPITWVENRRSLKVIGLNLLLDLIQLTHIIPKVKNRLVKIFNGRRRVEATAA